MIEGEYKTPYLRKLSNNKEHEDDAEKLCSLVSISGVGVQVRVGACPHPQRVLLNLDKIFETEKYRRNLLYRVL